MVIGSTFTWIVVAQAACVIKSLPYGCELSEHEQLLEDPFTVFPVAGGFATLPDTPGCGVEYKA